jgi:hypothetical protein
VSGIFEAARQEVGTKFGGEKLKPKSRTLLRPERVEGLRKGKKLIKNFKIWKKI